MPSKTWRIKKEHLNDEGCFAYGGGVPSQEELSQMAQGIQVPQQSQQFQMPTAQSVNPLNMMGIQPAAPVQAPQVEAPQAPQMPKTEQPQMTPQQPQAPGMANPYMAEAKTQGKIARAQVDEYKKAAQEQQRIETDYTTRVTQLDNERNQVVKYLDENPVDAERFMNTRSSGGKVATAIGLILGGIGSGLQGGKPNVALEFLNKQIDNDIKAQIENRHGKENLLANLERKYGNETTAKAVLQSTLQTQLANKINQAALASDDQLQLDRANQVTQQLMATANAPIQEAAKEQTFNSALQSGTDFAKLSPYMSEKQRARAVPGMGLARDEMSARKINEEIIPAYEGSKLGIQELKSFGVMDKFNPVSRTKAEAIQTRVIGQMRQVLLGPGTISDTERELVKAVVANPTSIFTLASEGKLDMLNNALDKDFAARLKGAGLSAPQQQQAAPAAAIKSFKPSK